MVFKFMSIESFKQTERLRVVAFLQNMWIKNPDKFQRQLDRCESDEHREKLRSRAIAYALFAGCITGRRLRSALGDWCDRIVWEEASPIIADNPRDYHPPDERHIKGVLIKHMPEVVLCFTRRGEDVIRRLCSCHVISAPHPAARHATVMNDLESACDQINKFEQERLHDWDDTAKNWEDV
jgi:hypothetical protein